VIPWLFLLVSLIGAAFTLNAFIPTRGRGFLFVPSFLASWLTMELAGHHLVWQAAAAALLVWLGALAALPGWIGLGITLLSWAGLVVLLLQGRRSARTMYSVVGTLAGVGPWPKVPWWYVLLPFPLRTARARVIRDVVYARVSGRRLKLDVFQPRREGGRRPAVLQIHGGAWVLGDKKTQGIPLLTHLADNGWVGFNVNYRLSPGATFPDHLVDLKRALAWIREHADDYGVDPGFVAVTGGSAGGHLTALMALTGNDPAYQRGFEDADTSVQAAVPFYGIYDFTDRLGTQQREFRTRLLQPHIMKAYFADEPERFHEASPLDRIHADAPPFLVVHGSRDTLAPLADARLFVERLRAISHAPVLFAEISGAQHAFDVFPSPRAVPVIEGVERFLDAVHRAYLDRQAEPGIPVSRAAAS
jgi:acetyl esterase/lipase